MFLPRVFLVFLLVLPFGTACAAVPEREVDPVSYTQLRAHETNP